MESDVPEGELTRDVKKRHEPSKAEPQAKLCGTVSTAAALCQGLLPRPEHPKKNIKPFCQPERRRLCSAAADAGSPINNQTSSALRVRGRQRRNANFTGALSGIVDAKTTIKAGIWIRSVLARLTMMLMLVRLV